MSFVMSSRAKRNPFTCMEVRLCVGQQLITFALASCRTRANRIGFPYAFCGAILCDVDASTSSIIVPGDGPCFEYPARFRANEMRRNCVPLSGEAWQAENVRAA